MSMRSPPSRWACRGILATRAVATVLALVALAAGYIPARRSHGRAEIRQLPYSRPIARNLVLLVPTPFKRSGLGIRGVLPAAELKCNCHACVHAVDLQERGRPKTERQPFRLRTKRRWPEP